MNDLVRRLDIKAGVMEMGEKIAWGSDTALMREAARAIEARDKRIAELEAVAEAAKKLNIYHPDFFELSDALRAAGYLK